MERTALRLLCFFSLTDAAAVMATPSVCMIGMLKKLVMPLLCLLEWWQLMLSGLCIGCKACQLLHVIHSLSAFYRMLFCLLKAHITQRKKVQSCLRYIVADPDQESSSLLMSLIYPKTLDKESSKQAHLLIDRVPAIHFKCDASAKQSQHWRRPALKEYPSLRHLSQI